ncbi:unnamed protein product, partial [Dovyalis caffra]
MPPPIVVPTAIDPQPLVSVPPTRTSFTTVSPPVNTTPFYGMVTYSKTGKLKPCTFPTKACTLQLSIFDQAQTDPNWPVAIAVEFRALIDN